MQTRQKLVSSTELRRHLATRQGMFVAAAVVTVAAAAFLLIFLSQYRDRVTDSSEVNVAVAKSLIEKGSSGDVIVEKGLYEIQAVRKSDLDDGAVTDPAALRGKVAADDIFPGDQMTSSDFATGTDSLASKITGTERAISIPLDPAHGLIGEVDAGDRVDVLAGFTVQGSFRGRPSMRTILQNALVLKAPAEVKTKAASLNKTQNVVIRASDEKAAQIAYAIDNGKVWLTLRPKAGAENSPPSNVALESLLAGTTPIRVGSGR
jgi:Flp pilus assembly protein CpaB